jgi:hypothetical protein
VLTSLGLGDGLRRNDNELHAIEVDSAKHARWPMRGPSSRSHLRRGVSLDPERRGLDVRLARDMSRYLATLHACGRTVYPREYTDSFSVQGSDQLTGGLAIGRELHEELRSQSCPFITANMRPRSNETSVT